MGTHRVYSVVILENIPQLILQTLYIVLYSPPDTLPLIAICSAVFSLISIIVTVLSMIMEKSLIKTQQYSLIEIDVCGTMISAKAEQLRRRVYKMKHAISGLIGIEESLLEMLKVETIPNGLRLRMYLYVGNENNYSDLLDDAKLSGQLAKLVFDAWDLKKMPQITKVRCSDHNTAEMQKVNSKQGLGAM